MSLTTFSYALKVWLSAVFVSPLLFIVGIYFAALFLNMNTAFQITSETLASDWDLYKTMVFFGAAFSFPAWLIFLLAIMMVMKSSDSARRRKQLTFAIAVALALGTSGAIFRFFGILFDTSFSYLSLSYCICIAAAGWYYKLEATERSEPEILIKEQ